MIIKLPIENIEKINIYVNTGRKTLAQIKAETKADYIINGGFFDMSDFTSSFGLIADGKIIKELGEQYGFAFKGNQPIFSYKNNAKADNYITAYPLLIRDGIKQIITTNVDNNSHRGRSAIGLTKDNQFVMCCVDDVTGYSDYTMAELMDALFDSECDVAINLDGGGSSQCDFNGQQITSTRIVHNYVCVYMKKEIELPKEEIMKKKIAIDIGHNYATVNGNEAFGYNEYQAMAKIADYMAIELTKYADEVDFKIIDYPEMDGRTELNTVVSDANKWGADVLISLHSNAFNGSARGWCAFAYSTTSGGYTLGHTIQKRTAELVDEIDVSRGIYIEPSNYAIIRDTLMPAILVEHGFHDNSEDVQIIMNNYENFAKANVLGILDYFGISEKVEEDTPVDKPVEDVETDPTLAEWAIEAQKFVVENGISDGTSPTVQASRQEIWTMLKRFHDKFIDNTTI